MRIPGERVGKVHQPAKAWSVPQLRALAAGEAGGTVVFPLADGAVRRVKRADFY